MERHETQEALSAYLDGRLTPAESAAARGHLADCADCRGTLAGLETGRRLARTAPRRPMPPGLAAAIRSRAAGSGGLPLPVHGERVGARGVVWRLLWAPAFSFAAAAAAFVLWLGQPPAPAGEVVALERLMAAHEQVSDDVLAGVFEDL